MKQVLTVFLLILWFTGLLVSCRTVGVASRFFTIANGPEPHSLDPAFLTSPAEQRIIQALFEGLVVMDSTGTKILPAMAESWTISSDGCEFRFKLRSAVWSDGSPVTAGQFVAGWLRVLDPELDSPVAWFPAKVLAGAQAYHQASAEIRKDATRLQALRNTVQVQALDDHLLWFRTTTAMPWIFQALCHPAFFPLPPRPAGIGLHEPAVAGQIVNGGFLLRDWEPGKQISLEKNPAYWDAGQTDLSGCRFLFSEDYQGALTQYQRGEADYLPQVPQDKVDNLAQSPDFQRAVGLESDFYLFDSHNPVLSDVRLRQALSLAIDRHFLVHTRLTTGSRIEAYGLIPLSDQAVPIHNPDADLVEARRLLAAAGHANGRGLPTLNLLASDSAIDTQVAAFLQNQWTTRLGLVVQIRNLPRRTFLAERRLGNFDIARGGWIADYPDDSAFLEIFAPAAAINDGGWSDPAFADLLQRAKTTPAGPVRANLLSQARILLDSELPALPLFFSTHDSLIDTRIWGGWRANQWDMHNLKFIYRNK